MIKKIITTLLLSFVVLSVPVSAGATIYPVSAPVPAGVTIYDAPCDYRTWRDAGNSFNSGFMGFLSLYQTLSTEERKQLKSLGVRSFSVTPVASLFNEKYWDWRSTKKTYPTVWSYRYESDGIYSL